MRKLTFGHITLGLSLASVLAAGVLLVAGYSFLRKEFPDVGVLKSRYPEVVYRGRDKDFDIRWSRSMPSQWVELGDVSRVAVGAIVVSEDWAFYSHNGFDANQIREAVATDLEKGKFARGASTITQQVIKNCFLEQDKSLWRKLKEIILAVQVEKKVSKRRILETYLNIAEWGEGVFGIGPAARRYFGKHPSQLTAKEGAFLAMLLPSPKRYANSFHARKLTDYARQRIDDILSKMNQARYLTDEERSAARGLPLSFEALESESLPSPSAL